MDENQDKQNNLIDTTDCLEAVGVFRGWKNFLFIIVILCLLLLQVSFWLVNTGCVKAEDKTKAAETTLEIITPPPASELVVPLENRQTKQAVETSNKIKKAAKQVTAEVPGTPPLSVPRRTFGEPNQPSQSGKVPEQNAGQQQKTGFFFGNIKFKQLALFIRFLNFVLILAAILYCLTMLFSLKVSMLGRLGGINHISRAFFLSLAMVVLLLPWQRFFDGVVAGAMYSPAELLSRCTAAETSRIFGTVLFYLRFTGYWLLVVLLLIFSQLRSFRWAKATLRRLEII